ncbi:MAG: ABC transporter ATP-binding protein [Candidatus Aminicenantes bacterium]|nr:ABC transporter ATP-binding protein [Candidatus Aminicenantes bacterium]
MAIALKIDSLHKTFQTGFIPKRKKILKGISLSVDEGKIFGYLGPNGAGKTTTIKCLLNLISPDRGTIEILGFPHHSIKARSHLGFSPENPYFYDYLSAGEFLDFYGRLFGLKKSVRTERAARLLRDVGLESSRHIQLRKFSRGMLQRIGLAQALINDPALVLLDEPLSGLDPIGRKEIRDLIVGLREQGKTVFLSSHILQDLEMICDEVAMIVEGKIVNQGRLADLISEKILFTEIVLSGVDGRDLEEFGEGLIPQGVRTLLKVYDEDKVAVLLDLVHGKKGKIHSLIPRTQTLEDLFVGTIEKQ